MIQKHIHWVRLNTMYTAIFKFKDSTNKTGTYCDVSISDNFPGESQDIWKILPKTKLMLQNCSYTNIIADSNLSKILWIIYHLVENNSKIIIQNLTYQDDRLISKGYYKRRLKKKSHGVYQVHRKTLPPPHTLNQGVSFCIPTGGDSEVLRACIKRILSFNMKKEIILSGIIKDDFPYIDSVKVVGEDISYPPLQICKKKNIAVESASYPLVCVIHDRILLPNNFPDLLTNLAPIPVMAIGGLFNLSRDWSSIGRYSDFNMAFQEESFPIVEYLSSDGNNLTTVFPCEAKFVLPRSAGWVYTSEKESHLGVSYVTGSFFITSKEFYNEVKLDETLFWEDYEDVQWGVKCASQFVPHVYNTDYFHVTLSVRPIILPPTNVADIDEDGKLTHITFNPLKIKLAKKSEINTTNHEFISRIICFNKKYNIPLSQTFELEKDLAKESKESFIVNLKKTIKTSIPANFCDIFIRDICLLLDFGLEVLDIEDMKIHQEYFSNEFDFYERIVNNDGFKKWALYFNEGVNLKIDKGMFFEENSLDEESLMFENAKINREHLNGLFSLDYCGFRWFQIFKLLRD